MNFLKTSQISFAKAANMLFCFLTSIATFLQPCSLITNFSLRGKKNISQRHKISLKRRKNNRNISFFEEKTKFWLI